jgi:hypothetical protein
MNDRGVGLGEATRRAVERAERERRQAGAGGPLPQPGDLYALPATADHQLEWLVVAPADAGSWVVLPADLSPVAGAADVEVPADEPGGPLTVYGRFPVTVPAALLAPELRSGRIAEARRAAAERRWRDLAGGAETPVREADHDPDYRRRLGELAAAQQALAAAAAAAEPDRHAGDREGGGGSGAGGAAGGGAGAAVPVVAPARLRRPQPPRFRPPPWLTALAAVLALAVVGLAAWNLRLLRQLDELSGARQVATGPELIVDEVTRGGDLPLPDADFVVLSLVWQRPPDPAERFRVSFVGPDGEELAAVRELAPDPRLGEASIEVPRRVLVAGARLRLFRLGARGEAELIVERSIRLASD